MQNKIVRIILFFISLALLVMSAFSLMQDLVYFISKIETTARIVSINDVGSHEPFRVEVEYYNKYVEKEISCNVILRKSDRVKINGVNNRYAKIYYSKYFPCALYFVEFNAPTLGVFFIDGIMILLMSLAVYAFKDGFKKMQ